MNAAARTLKLEMPRPGDARRWFAGVAVGSRCHDVSAALVAVAGHGTDAAADVVGIKRVCVPREVYAPVLASGVEAVSIEAVAELRSQLAEVEASLLGDLLAAAGVAPQRVLAVGALDPGMWKFDRGAPCGYLGLCDGPRLAELSGLNVIEAFPARDLAQGGQGGPIAVLAEWILLRDAMHKRALLDLGRTTRLSYLPPAQARDAAARIVAFEVGPGTSILDHLAHRLTGGEQHCDAGGRLAVQGRQIPDLIAHWLRNPYFERPMPRWHPRGVRPERFLTDALHQAAEHGWPVQDLLCSATHFIAQAVAEALAKRLPEDDAPDEILVTGGGQHNGMLLREIADRVGKPLVRLSEILPSLPAEQADARQRCGDVLEPAAAAVLAMLYLDQTPANLPAVTGAAVPRLLGSLTPGAPQNWQRLLQSLSEAPPAARTLRAAM